MTSAFGTVLAAGVVGGVTMHVRGQLQARYDEDAVQAGAPESARQIGAAFITPALWSVVIFAALLFVVLTMLARRAASPLDQVALSRDLARLGAWPLLVQALYAVWAARTGVMTSAAAVVSAGLAFLAVVVLCTTRRRGWWHASACAVAGAATLAESLRAVLVAPAVLAVGSLLLAAAVTAAADAASGGCVPVPSPSPGG